MLQHLKDEVCEANLSLVRDRLVILTWGNVSGVDRDAGMMVIKPSGVDYAKMKPKDMVVVSLETGKPVEGRLRPSSDTPSHLVLYREFTGIGGIAHTHSSHATAWAQACRELPPFGTTHADHFYGPVPCTRTMTAREVDEEYEANTGRVIVETFRGRDPLQVPAVFVARHAPFAWGSTVHEAVKNAVTLERIAGMATETLILNSSLSRMDQALLDKHYLRKHGTSAYYGQQQAPKKKK